MAEEDGARHVLAAINGSGAPDADLNRLTAIILNLASDAARQALEALMTTTEWTTHPFIESFKKEGIEVGRQEGIEKGLQKGLQAGLQKGRVKAKAEGVLKIIDARGVEVTKEQRKEVDDCTDLTQLDRWFDRALTAKTAADIFQD
jgi:flagellar biosynthesis/type III secretory pathway protein FliH